MLISKETKVCISISKNPGNLGATIFNTGFNKLSLDYIYKPFKVEGKDLGFAIAGIKALGIRGCGVSMPHKINVIQYLDELDHIAKQTGAVNTIVNDGGALTGYNTDYEAVHILTKTDFPVNGKNVLIIGAGGVARSIICAVRDNRAKDIIITNRTEETGRQIADQFKIRYVPFDKIDNLSGGLLINATPLGMKENDLPIVDENLINNFEAVLDVVVSRLDTHLLTIAKTLNKKTLSGIKMSSLQAMAQFKLYTGRDIPLKVVETSIKKFLNNSN